MLVSIIITPRSGAPLSLNGREEGLRLCWGEGVMPSDLPIVMCPGCNTPMIPSDDVKPLQSSGSLQEVTYTCQSCGVTTVRAIKVDEE